MKLNKLLILSLCLAVFACSDSSDDSGKKEGDNSEKIDDNSILIKKVISTRIEDNKIFTSDFEYEENRLLSITEGDDKTKFSYDNNNKVVKIENFRNDILKEYIIIEYDSNNELTNFKQILLGIDTDGKPFDVYNHVVTDKNEKTISLDTFTGDLNAQNTFDYKITVSLSNNNISGIAFRESTENRWIYEYDDRNGILKNIHDIDIINLVTIETEYSFEFYGNKNNLLKLINNDYVVSEDRYEYTYNDQEYPKSAKSYSSSSDGFVNDKLLFTVEYLYE